MFTVYWDMPGCWCFYNFNRPSRWPKHLGAQKLSFVQYLETKLVYRRQPHGIHTTLKNTEKEVGTDCTDGDENEEEKTAILWNLLTSGCLLGFK